KHTEARDTGRAHDHVVRQPPHLPPGDDVRRMRLLEPVREQPAGETPRDPHERRRPHDDGAPPQRLTWRRAKNRMISANPNAASTTPSHSLPSRSSQA